MSNEDMNEPSSCDKGPRKDGSCAEEDPGRSTGDSSLFSAVGFFEQGDDLPDQTLFSSRYHQEGLQDMDRVWTIDDDLYLDVVSLPFQACDEEMRAISSIRSQESEPIIEPDHQETSPFASFEILNNLRRGNSKTNGRKRKGLSFDPTTIHTTSTSPLCTNHLTELAAKKFIQSNSGTFQELSAIVHPYDFSISNLSVENAQSIRLLFDLLSCADKIGNREYDSVSELLEKCREVSSTNVNTVHRLVYYFTEALCEKVDREIGMFRGNDPTKIWYTREYHRPPTTDSISFYEKSPIVQINEFTSVQCIVEHVSACKKVHIIDLGVICGVRQNVLMEALASESPLEHLKITAIITTVSKVKVEETGTRLRTLSESLNMSFSFNTIMIENIADLVCTVDPEDAVVVWAPYCLNQMIAKQNQLEMLMRVLRRIKPRVMVVCEAEANINSPVFVNRFVEALFFYGAYFDILEDSLKDDPEARTFAESEVMRPVIRNVLASEGEERKFRVVGINVWRAFFERFGMVETEVSKLSLQHADLVRMRFECRDSCTLDMDGMSLIIGWKGTPIYSLSAWRFKEMRSMKNF